MPIQSKREAEAALEQVRRYELDSQKAFSPMVKADYARQGVVLSVEVLAWLVSKETA